MVNSLEHQHKWINKILRVYLYTVAQLSNYLYLEW